MRKRAGTSDGRPLSARYGIAEWFGRDINLLIPDERQSLGQLAVTQGETRSLLGAPECPFLSNLIPGALCNKSGGVCSMRRYLPDGSTAAPDEVVTVCPSRFLEPVGVGKMLFSWIAETMLDSAKVIAVKETPFLRRIASVHRSESISEDMAAEAQEEQKQAGRIDWILVNPETVGHGELEWCAVETQALYFAGMRMNLEFDAYANAPSDVLFPRGKRRPDYRSSGPKRLWPQLDVKVPVLRSWGKKIAVVVDRFFYNNMNVLADPSPRARNDKERRDNADVAWFIVDYDENLHLVPGEVIYTSLDSSRIALNATEPLSKSDFTANLQKTVSGAGRTRKVFKL